MEEIVRSLPEQFEKAMDDDFNTAAALGVLQRATRDLNRLIAEARQNDAAGFPPKLLEEVLAAFTRLGAVLGILTSDPAEYFKQKQDEGMKDVAVSEEQILRSIEERTAARVQKNWKRADEIRDELLSKGIILEDSAQGTIWKVKT
jgi:cysteinyl-tRNA synthetase